MLKKTFLYFNLLVFGFACTTKNVEPVNPLDEYVGDYQLVSMYYTEYKFETFNQDDPSYMSLGDPYAHFNFYLDSEDDDDLKSTGGGIIEYITTCGLNTNTGEYIFCVNETHHLIETHPITWILLEDGTISIRDNNILITHEINIQELNETSLLGELKIDLINDSNQMFEVSFNRLN